MRIAHTLSAAAGLVSAAILFTPAAADEVCDKNCVGPACATSCRHEPDMTIGRDLRDRDDEVIIEERNRHRKPGLEFRERERRPGVDVDIQRR